jgi:hypothetical protein
VNDVELGCRAPAALAAAVVMVRPGCSPFNGGPAIVVAPPANGLWLAEHLPSVRLVMRDGEGHLGILEHLGEMLDALTAPDPGISVG